MIRQRVLPEDASTELLGGLLVLKDQSDAGGDPLMHGPKHRLCIRLLTSLAGKVQTATRFAQVQLPVICANDEMPEPDFAIIRGTDREYAERLPTGADTFMVAEVADSSLERDAEEKLSIYAAAGIPQYLIVNLRNLAIEQYTDPDAAAATYRTKATFSRGQNILLHGGPDGDIDVAVADLLP